MAVKDQNKQRTTQTGHDTASTITTALDNVSLAQVAAVLHLTDGRTTMNVRAVQREMAAKRRTGTHAARERTKRGKGRRTDR